jgi:uncharacterized repeat protein (TIGR02059 family)
MKKTLIMLFLYVSLTLSGATYYVAPNGSDSNTGTITSPFFTLNKAWTVVAAGDIIYMRGGTYRYGTTFNSLANKSGTSGNTIKIWAYPGEYPVIDYAGVNLTGQKIGLRLNSISYVHFKGFRIANMAQENTSNAWPHYGIILYNDVSNCIFEQLEVDHIGGTGFTIADRCNNNLFLNCDSHHHADPYSSEPYGMSDGFESGSHGTNTSTNNTFKNCRAWSNSDDGWDFRQADGVYTVDGCWSFRNGFIPGTSTTGGNGDGYKLGGKTSPGTSTILRTIKNSLAFENRATGITPEPDAADNVFGLDVINCTSYKNSRDLGEGINTGNYNNYVRLRNCISYGNYRTNAWMQGGAVNDHNSWDIPKTVTDADFQSVSSSGVDGPRQSDGSLPVTNFLHLAAGSSLIDVGVNVGLAYAGTAPDLGAFESGSSAPPPPQVPVIGTSSIANATPSLLELTYDLTLSNTSIPAATSFSVLVNTASITIKSVAVTGTKVQLTLAAAIKYGDVVTVAYTKPSTSPIQTTAGGIAASFTARAATNNLAAPPIVGSTTISDATPSKIDMVYNLSLNTTSVPAVSSYSVLVNGAAVPVSLVGVSGTNVQLTLANAVKYGDVVTVSYIVPATNPVQTALGGIAASFTARSAINNLGTVLIPGTASISNATPSLLELVYNLPLSSTSIPSNTAFSVFVNSIAVSVNSVAISGSDVQLTLASPIKYGDIVTVSYTAPSTNPLQTTAGGIAVSFTALTVSNNLVAPPDVPPVIPVTITMNISPNHVHRVINISLSYTGTVTDALAPELVRITYISGQLMLEQLVATGATSIKLPVNIYSGIYTVHIFANGVEMASKRIQVY